MSLAAGLCEAGFDVRGYRPPTVPEGTSRLRLTVRFGVTPADWARSVGCIAEARVSAPHRGLFVTGTDTGVGKTLVSAALMAVLGDAAVYYKPVQTGDDDDTATVAA